MKIGYLLSIYTFLRPGKNLKILCEISRVLHNLIFGLYINQEYKRFKAENQEAFYELQIFQISTKMLFWFVGVVLKHVKFSEFQVILWYLYISDFAFHWCP
jgi:hypothetical protein